MNRFKKKASRTMENPPRRRHRMFSINWDTHEWFEQRYHGVHVLQHDVVSSRPNVLSDLFFSLICASGCQTNGELSRHTKNN